MHTSQRQVGPRQRVRCSVHAPFPKVASQTYRFTSDPVSASSLSTAVQYPYPPLQALHRGPVSLPTTPASPPRSTAIHHSRLSTAVQCPCTPLQPLHRGPVSLPSTPASPPRSSIPAHHYRATVLPRGCGLNRLLRPSLWPSRLRASSMA